MAIVSGVSSGQSKSRHVAKRGGIYKEALLSQVDTSNCSISRLIRLDKVNAPDSIICWFSKGPTSLIVLSYCFSFHHYFKLILSVCFILYRSIYFILFRAIYLYFILLRCIYIYLYIIWIFIYLLYFFQIYILLW